MLSWLNRNAQKEQILDDVSAIVSGHPSVELCLSLLCTAPLHEVMEVLPLIGLVHCLRYGISLI